MKMKVAALAAAALVLIAASTAPRLARAWWTPSLTPGTYVVAAYVTNVVELGNNTACGLALNQSFTMWLDYAGPDKSATAVLLDPVAVQTIELNLPRTPSTNSTSWGPGPYSGQALPSSPVFKWAATNFSAVLTETSTQTFVGSMTLPNWPAAGVANACNVTITYSAYWLNGGQNQNQRS